MLLLMEPLPGEEIMLPSCPVEASLIVPRISSPSSLKGKAWEYLGKAYALCWRNSCMGQGVSSQEEWSVKN